MNGLVEVFDGYDALVRRAADTFLAAADAAVRDAGRFVVALAGGATPRGLYELLASEPYASRVPWARVEWFWGDERCVGPDDPASNYRMARDTLLSRVPAAEERVHRMRGEEYPPKAAAEYEAALRDTLGTPAGPPRRAAGARFDLVILGMGDNGHTASLFPGGAAVHEHRRWVMAEYVPAVAAWRLTLTPPVINAAAAVTFLVAGAAKAEMLQRVLEGPRDPQQLPSQAINPGGAGALWLVDAAAAGALAEGRPGR